MKTICLLLVGVVTGASALVSAYHVDPKTAAMSGKVSGNPEYGGVSEVLTVNFDLPITASLFCGSSGDTGSYSVNIYSYPGGVTQLAYKHGVQPPKDHDWLSCSLTVDYPDSFIKGRQVEVRWTRACSGV